MDQEENIELPTTIRAGDEMIIQDFDISNEVLYNMIEVMSLDEVCKMWIKVTDMQACVRKGR